MVLVVVSLLLHCSSLVAMLVSSAVRTRAVLLSGSYGQHSMLDGTGDGNNSSRRCEDDDDAGLKKRDDRHQRLSADFGRRGRRGRRGRAQASVVHFIARRARGYAAARSGTRRAELNKVGRASDANGQWLLSRSGETVGLLHSSVIEQRSNRMEKRREEPL